MRLVITGQVAREAIINRIRLADIGLEVLIREPKRNLAANALLHACITDVADQMEWAGAKQSVETWKRLLVAAWMRATDRHISLLPALDGNGFDALYQRTSALTKSECSELLEYIFAWGADKGVKFREPHDA